MFNFDPNLVLACLGIMVKGMVGIFIVILVTWALVPILKGVTGSKKKRRMLLYSGPLGLFQAGRFSLCMGEESRKGDSGAVWHLGQKRASAIRRRPGSYGLTCFTG